MGLIRLKVINGKPVKQAVPVQKVRQIPDPKAKASDWRVWVQTARDLRKAVHLLQSQKEYPSFDIGPAYLLLAGYCLENLVKAVLTRKGYQQWKSDGRLSWGIGNGHDLPRLFARAKLKLEAWEIEFLGRLKIFVEWAGRYPIPNGLKRALEMDKQAMSDLDLSKFEQIFDRLMQELK